MTTTFTATSGEPYDRHVYELVLKDGRSFLFSDYEEMRSVWFQGNSLKQLSHVNVRDIEQNNVARPKGFS